MAESNNDHDRAVPPAASPQGSSRTGEIWTIVGTVSTIWAVVISLILAFLSDIGAWIAQNTAWFIPLLLAGSLSLTLALGFSIGMLRRDGQGLAHRPPPGAGGHRSGPRRHDLDFEFATLATVLERESEARNVWIVSPRLFYDIHDPEFRKVISANKARNVRYRYIVPGSPEVLRNLRAYREIYKETPRQQESEFLTLPQSEFTTFLTELAIYDPDEPTMYAFAIPPSSRNIQEDVIIFNRELSQQYAKKFSDIWLEHKHAWP